MEIELKFKLIDFLYLSPNELHYLDQFVIPDEIAQEILKDKEEALYDYLKILQYDETLPESYRLLVACLKRRVTPITVKWKDEEIDENEDDKEFNYYDENLSEEEKQTLKDIEKQNNEIWREREKAYHKSLPKLKQYSQDELNTLMFNYFWEKFPLLQNGFDRSTYYTARDSFYNEIGISWYKYQLPSGVYKKIITAEEYVKQEIVERFKKMEVEKTDEWVHEYKSWMKQRGITKYTKTSIKAFFDSKKLKVSTLTIDAIKEKL